MAQLKRRVCIIHPFHPRRGETFDLVNYRRSWGTDFLDCHDAQGHLISLPLAWTDAAELDPFVVLSAGRAYFRVCDLVRLVGLITAQPAYEQIPKSGESVRHDV